MATWPSGDCTVTLDEATGVVTVSGQGAMMDYLSDDDLPWFSSKKLFKSLLIEDGVTNIGAYAFFYCPGFTGSLTIPSSVTNIGAYALSYGGFTGNLTIPNSVTNIGEEAFRECDGFTGSLTIPSSVTSIGVGAFWGCRGLNGSLTIPSSITIIEDQTFCSCSFTGSLIIPNSVTSIGGAAFSECHGFTGSLTIPSSVTSIGGGAFWGCMNLEGSLTISSSVINIGGGAFGWFFGIREVKNYAKVQTCDSSAFNDIAGIFYGYPENTEFKTAAGSKWRDIAEILPYIVTFTDKQGKDLYPRTKGSAVYLPDGKTVEKALGGVSFWRGTQAEYDALATKPTNTVYCIVGGNVIVT